MPSLFSFPSEPHPVWSPLAKQIHAVVFHRPGKLSAVQGFVRQWAAEWQPDDPWPLPPDHRSISPAEKWAGLAAIHDAYWKGDKIDPWPLPTENNAEWLRLWPENVEWQRTDLEPWKKWAMDGGLIYRRLMAQPLSRLADPDEPFIREWLRDVTAGSAPGRPQALAAVSESTAADYADLLEDPAEVIGSRFGIEIPNAAPPAASEPKMTAESVPQSGPQAVKGFSPEEVQRIVQLIGGGDAVKILAVARNEALTVDQRMRALVTMDQRFDGYDSTKWAELLAVGAAAVRQTEFWKTRKGRKE